MKKETIQIIPFAEKVRQEADALIASFRVFADGDFGSEKQERCARMCAVICANHLRVNAQFGFISSDDTANGQMISIQDYWFKVIEEIKAGLPEPPKE